jgi:hypothetical protein
VRPFLVSFSSRLPSLVEYDQCRWIADFMRSSPV